MAHSEMHDMAILHSISAVVFILAGISMLVFGARAQARRSRAREQPLLKRLRLVPHYGKREEFTEMGWRYRNLALRMQIVALVAMILWGISLRE